MDGRTSYPRAAPGFGKRSAPGQLPPRPDQFAHLETREAVLAEFIDKLPDGADISIRTLAAHSKLYGQAAVASAVRNLIAAGYMRRNNAPGGSGRWTRGTWFSRTPRDEAWWDDLANGRLPARFAPEPDRAALFEEACRLLSRLAYRDRRLTLSQAEVRALAPIAAGRLGVGLPAEELVRILTADLPRDVPHPASFTRRRLTASVRHPEDALWRVTTIR